MTSDHQKNIDTAIRLHEKGDLRTAADICREVLKEEPENFEALHLLGVIFSAGGIIDQAIPLFERAIAIGGPNSGVLFNYGVALRADGRTVQAARAFRHAAEASPGRVDCWYNLGEAYRQLGRLTDAVNGFQKAIDLEPENEPAWFNLGNVLLDLGRIEDAIEAYEKAVELGSDNVQAQNNLGIALRHGGRLEEAVTVLGRVLEIDPANSGVYNNLGITLQALNRLEEAVLAFTGAVKAAPGNIDANCNLGKLYQILEKIDQAAICYRSALTGDNFHLDAHIGYAQCRQRQGRYEDALNSLGILLEAEPENFRALIAQANILRDLGEYDRALAAFEQVLSVVPDNPAALTDKALTLQHQGNPAQAIDLYREALNLDPDNEQIHSNMAQALLLGDQYSEGWEAFERRLQSHDLVAIRNNLPGAPWAGEDISGKQLLVWCEQGLGDAIQFVRYLSLVRELGAHVALQCPERMIRLLKSLGEQIDYISDIEAAPSADFNAPLMSLPHLLGDIPIPSPQSYLIPEKELVAQWREKIAGDGLRIGIAWQGNPSYQADRSRSIPLAELKPLLQLPNATFFGLQKNHGLEQLDNMSGENRMINLGDDLDHDAAFIDTAAIMASLDLIITSDTAIPHLAGALGRPVWMVTSYAPDWRWGLGRTDCPWYPSLRLFRQSSPGDWAGVVADVIEALKIY